MMSLTVAGPGRPAMIASSRSVSVTIPTSSSSASWTSQLRPLSALAFSANSSRERSEATVGNSMDMASVTSRRSRIPISWRGTARPPARRSLME